MKPADVKWNTYVDYSKEISNKDAKFKIGDVIFQIGLKKFLWLKKWKILCHRLILLMILMEKKLLEHCTKKKLRKVNQKEFTIKKVIKGKVEKLYAKWKGYYDLFNGWIDNKDKA